MGKIPRDLFEDELVPLFEKAGQVWDLRLMMDPLSGLNRGYAFITFCTKEAAQEAVKLVSPRPLPRPVTVQFYFSLTLYLNLSVCVFNQYNNREIRPGKHIGVCISVANNRLFVGSIPKSKTKEQILEEFAKVTGTPPPHPLSSLRHSAPAPPGARSVTNTLSPPPTEGLNDVILYTQPDDKRKNRGFCFLEYEDHKSAAQARRRLMSGKVKVWGALVTVEWADPIEDPDPEIMAKVRDGDLSSWLRSCPRFSAHRIRLSSLSPSGEGAVREEPGEQRDGGHPGEDLRGVREAGAGEEAEGLRLRPL